MKRWENRRKWSVVGGAFGEALDTLVSKGVLKQLLSVVGLVLVDLYLLGSDVRKRHCLMVRPRRCIWGGDRWNRRESEEKALLDGHKD